MELDPIKWYQVTVATSNRLQLKRKQKKKKKKSGIAGAVETKEKYLEG